MRSDGYKTKTAVLILKYLEENKDKAVSVQDVYEYLDSCDDKINITTVYRRLDKLVQDKKVITHSSEDGKNTLYQYIAGGDMCLSHLHFQCTKCSKIIHLDCDDSSEFTEHFEKEHGVQLDFTKTILFGLCEKCRKL
jgi:Fur family ferric uptake transcriptional regulator